MKRVKCPCCGYFTHLVENYSEPLHLFEICDVCFWQYDLAYHDKPDMISGPNYISLNEARKNYKQFGVCKQPFINDVRKPLPEELPENNVE
jgi:isopentenyldiphosphate isomerase